jgi:hypothetical protein
MTKPSLLRPYQRAWFRALLASRNSLIVGPRQVGKDFTLQTWAAYEAHRVHGISPMAGVLAMNKDQRLSSNFLRGVTHFARQCSKAGIYRYDESSGKSGSATEVRWIVGEGHAFCKALPSQPDSPQGFTGSIAWNEVGANRHDPEEIWAQVRAASSADERFRLALVSNATKRGSWLDRLLHDDEDHWRAKRAAFGANIHVTTIYDVYPEGLPAWLDEIRQSMTRAAWARWYEVRFVDGGEGPLAEYMRDVADTVDLGAEVGRPIISVDPGITTDPTGVVVLSPLTRGWRVTHSELWYQKPVDDQIEAILALYRSIRPRLVVVDPGTQGHYIYSSLQRQLGAQVVVAGKANAEAYNRQLQRLEDLTRSAAFSVPAEHHAVGEHLGEICRDERDRVVVPYVPDGPKRRHHCDLGVAVMMASDHIGATVRVAPSAAPAPSWLSGSASPSGNNPFR